MFKAFLFRYIGLLLCGIGGFVVLVSIFVVGSHHLTAVFVGTFVGCALFVFGRYLEYVSNHTVRVK